MGVLEYTEQLTYLLFLKMAHERAIRPLAAQQIVPEECSWQRLLDAKGDRLESEYSRILTRLARQPGVIGTIHRKLQDRIQDPAKPSQSRSVSAPRRCGTSTPRPAPGSILATMRVTFRHSSNPWGLAVAAGRLADDTAYPPSPTPSTRTPTSHVDPIFD